MMCVVISLASTARTSLGHTSIRYNRYRELTPRVIELPERKSDSSTEPDVVVQCTRMYLHVPISSNVLRHIGYFHFRSVMTQQNRTNVAASRGGIAVCVLQT
jgi:hypothetical protein